MERRDLSYAFGLLCIIFFWIGLGGALTAALQPLCIRIFPDLIIHQPASSPLGYYLLAHIGFLTLLGGILLVSVKILPDSPETLIRDTPPARVVNALRAGGIWLVLLGAATLLVPRELELTFSARAFFRFLPAVLLFSPLQALAEELLFRSYLRRWSLHHRIISSPWVLCPISGLVFLLAHTANPEMGFSAGRVYIMLYYFTYGVLLMYITIDEGGIESAVGIHTANNLFALLVINYEHSALPSPSIWQARSLEPVYSLLTLAAVGALYLLVRKVLPRLAGRRA